MSESTQNFFMNSLVWYSSNFSSLLSLCFFGEFEIELINICSCCFIFTKKVRVWRIVLIFSNFFSNALSSLILGTSTLWLFKISKILFLYCSRSIVIGPTPLKTRSLICCFWRSSIEILDKINQLTFLFFFDPPHINLVVKPVLLNLWSSQESWSFDFVFFEFLLWPGH